MSSLDSNGARSRSIHIALKHPLVVMTAKFFETFVINTHIQEVLFVTAKQVVRS